MTTAPTPINLVLQGPHASRAALERVAQVAGAHHIKALHAHALRCEQLLWSEQLQRRVDAAATSEGIDATFIAPGRVLRDFKLVAMDMDSTLITIECIDEIADMQGLKAQVAAITEAAMRGELAFSDSLTRRVALLEGLDAAALERVYDERLHISPGGEAMLAAVKQAGLQTLLVSGGFTFFTERLKRRLGFNHTQANELEIIDGKLTGRVRGGIVDAQEKMRTVLRVCADMGIDPSQLIVMGDGANDLAMMQVAGLSVAFRAKPVVRAQADVALNFTGLDGILAILA